MHINDVCKIVMWLIDNKVYHGNYDVGTGYAVSVEHLAQIVIDYLGHGKIVTKPFPKELKGKYQYHTQANITPLRNAGCEIEFRDVQTGVFEYLAELQANESNP